MTGFRVGTLTYGCASRQCGEPGLPDVCDDLRGIALVHLSLRVGQTAHVERGVRQHGVHEGKTKYGQHGVDDGHHHQVPVVGVAFLQLVLRPASDTMIIIQMVMIL